MTRVTLHAVNTWAATTAARMRMIVTNLRIFLAALLISGAKVQKDIYMAKSATKCKKILIFFNFFVILRQIHQ